LGVYEKLKERNGREKQHCKEIGHCVICTDNDEAGNKAAKNVTGVDGISADCAIPPIDKDWNETLQKIRNEVKPLEDVRKDINFIDSH
jgi:DNA primase